MWQCDIMTSSDILWLCAVRNIHEYLLSVSKRCDFQLVYYHIYFKILWNSDCQRCKQWHRHMRIERQGCNVARFIFYLLVHTSIQQWGEKMRFEFIYNYIRQFCYWDMLGRLGQDCQHRQRNAPCLVGRQGRGPLSMMVYRLFILRLR